MIRKRDQRTHPMILAGVFLVATGLAWPLDAARARSPEIYTGILSATAVGGYDPVAYFSEGRAMEGKRDITWTWKGVTWRFASEKNRDAFKAKPEAYAP